MISYRQSDLFNTINKPRTVYYSYDTEAKQPRTYDPKTNKVHGEDIGDVDLAVDDILKRVGDYYIVDDQMHKNRQTFNRNDYVGEYDSIDDAGNFVFKDNRHSKFFGKTFPVKDWVLTDNHERGLHLERRPKT